MTRVFWSLSAVLLVGLVACVSTTKPEEVERCAEMRTCSDNQRDTSLAPSGESADSLAPTGTGGTSSVGGTTSSTGVAGMASTGGSGATGSSASAGGGQPGNDATGGTSATGGGLSSGGAVANGGSPTGGNTASGGTSSSGGIGSTGGTSGKGGSTGSGAATSTGGTKSTGGTTITGGAPGTGGTSTGGTSTAADVCAPLTAVIDDFATSGCSYGNGTYGEMDSVAWSYGNGTSAISATCASGNWTFSGTVGVTTTTGANQAGFGFTLMGKGYDNATKTEVSCKTFDLSAYSGFSIRLSSASGAITKVGIGVNLADNSKAQTEIAVTRTPTTVPVTWTQLKIASAAQITEIWGYFISGASSVTNDLVISHFGLQ